MLRIFILPGPKRHKSGCRHTRDIGLTRGRTLRERRLAALRSLPRARKGRVKRRIIEASPDCLPRSTIVARRNVPDWPQHQYQHQNPTQPSRAIQSNQLWTKRLFVRCSCSELERKKKCAETSILFGARPSTLDRE